MRSMRFDRKLALLCERKGWNQSDLTRAVSDVSKNTVSRWFSGAVRPYDGTLIRLANVLGVPIDYLCRDELDEPPPASELSDDEAFILEVLRSLGLERQEAIRRLATSPKGAEVPHGPGRILAVRDETEADMRRERERNRPVERRPAERPREGVAKGEGEGGTR